jgi:hypothetical protein
MVALDIARVDVTPEDMAKRREKLHERWMAWSTAWAPTRVRRVRPTPRRAVAWVLQALEPRYDDPTVQRAASAATTVPRVAAADVQTACLQAKGD